MSGSVLIMAGGTGGHVFPALAVADELRQRAIEVTWLGTRQGIEARVVPAANIPIDWIDARGLRGKGLVARIAGAVAALRCVVQALRVVARRRPAVVLGMGGYASGPGGLAAWLLRRPLIVHEQNSVAGLTNRILARFARHVLSAFPGAFGPRGNVRVVGNPLRSSFLAGTERSGRTAPTGRAPRVLIVGGSLGALALNETVPAALGALPADVRPEIWHQGGERHLDVAQRGYASAGVAARVDAFIDDMAAAYRWADLVVCRAGALTVSEIAASGVAAVLIPFPYAVDDHQTGNARFLQSVGAAIIVPQDTLSPTSLAAELAALLSAPDQLVQMGQCARKVARPDATRDVADLCETLGAAA